MLQRSNGQLPEAAARQLLIGVGAPVPPPKLAGLEQPQRQEPALPSWQTPEQAPRQVQICLAWPNIGCGRKRLFGSMLVLRTMPSPI